MKNLIMNFEKTISSSKFAVLLLVVAIIYFSFATIAESYFGTPFASALFYRSWGMGALAFASVLSIYFALLKHWGSSRKKIAFQIMHWGILVIFAGGFFSYWAGIDGSITLYPHRPTRLLSLDQSEVALTPLTDRGESHLFSVAASAFPSVLNISHQGLVLGRFLPFAKDDLSWSSPSDAASGYYDLLQDGEVVAPLVFSHSRDSQFRHEAEVGPLRLYFLPKRFLPYFENKIWGDELLCFDMSAPTAVGSSKAEERKGRSSCFNHAALSQAPVILIFEDSLFLYNKDLKKLFPYHSFKTGNARLPWMNLELAAKKITNDEYPDLGPVFEMPRKNNEELFAAVEMQMGDQRYWLKQSRPEEILLNGVPFQIELRKKNFTVPFSLSLVSFNLAKEEDGTHSSYSSNLVIYPDEGDQYSAKISMNQPLSIGVFNLYQSSYFQLDESQYASVLTVSYDPGRPYKYLGSFLLILGGFLYYLWAIRPAGDFEGELKDD